MAAAPEPTVDDERELLLRFLRWKREQLLEKADGLTDAQVRWTPEPGVLVPLIGIVSHLTNTEWRWTNGRFLGEPFPPRTDEWHVAHDVPWSDVRARYLERADATDALVRAAPSLAAPALGREGDGPPVHEVFGYDTPADLRYCVLHLIEETAQHLGHADATRELLDRT